MEANEKSWLAGCGCGCGTFVGTLLLVGGGIVLTAYLLWEVGDVRSELVEGPAALTCGSIVGTLVGLLAGIGAVFLVRRRMLRSAEAQQANTGG